MEQYGNAVLEQYHLPTDEEIARLEEFDGDDEEEEEGEGDDNDVYGYDNNNDQVSQPNPISFLLNSTYEILLESNLCNTNIYTICVLYLVPNK